MVSVCFYFQVHQPKRLKRGDKIKLKGVKTLEEFEKRVFDHEKNKKIMKKVAEKCYLPTNKLMLGLIDNYKRQRKKFKISYSLSGIFIEQAEKYMPEVIETFQWLADTGCVEFLDETYYHSLSSLWIYDEDLKNEFIEQIKLHRELIWSYFKQKPKVFRNTELIFNNDIAKVAKSLGYKAILAEGIEHILNGKSPEHIYHAYNTKMPVLLRHYRLSDDISFRFSAPWFEAWPLTADKFASWVASCQGEVINLFMDYETFGEHQWECTGIFEFMKHLPYELLKYEHVDFVTPTEAVERYPVRGTIDVPGWQTISWADIERDLSAWLSNDMQRTAFKEMEKIGRMLKNFKSEKKEEFKRLWRELQTSDHLYYCCTKFWADGDIHKYFSPYNSPFLAFEGLIKSLDHLQYLMLKEREKVREEAESIKISSAR